ncbi:aldolase [Candidatus Roizmanbacteria bacterium RIFCSPHIGHO2_02_FULL_38_11]|uniref:Aldolase n=1 Tax=Candidatus Roizmanbacteria bacterium RIFCSPHIGHO2_02_FULL_38_11 TaxID=1802039 RepID=A0A1F7H309_9BACT|nr:MAG: aldolase [Candidatus Roizmanbacteria bacterium RIFCSPHIGHO2_02_FULL_38_11]
MIYKTLDQLSLAKKLSIDDIVYSSMFSPDDQVKKKTSQIIYQQAKDNQSPPASIHNFYLAAGKGEIKGFTVPAMNIRTLTYDTARIIFRLAKKHKIGALIFEIAKSEQGYTDQKPSLYAVAVLAAAVKEKYKGPVFLQGDHYQFKAKKFKEDRTEEINNMKKLIKESVEAGFYNIDIDGSTLVDLEQKKLSEQQRNNYEVTALMTKYIRQLEAKGITISIGGEIGHIGGKNSTPEEFKAFMDNYLKLVKGIVGISKVSVQTGTSHGGIVLPDGSIAKVDLDFAVLKSIGQVARKIYHIGGPVQHGASTLPDGLFHQFPKTGTLEIHLATGFQNIVYQHLPASLKKDMYEWVKKNCQDERKESWNDDQFIYKMRKKALGPFKQKLWELSEKEKKPILTALEKQFEFLFKHLNVFGTKRIVEKYIH